MTLRNDERTIILLPLLKGWTGVTAEVLALPVVMQKLR